MKSSLVSVFIGLGLSTVLIGFQNCSHEVSFDSNSSDGLARKQELVALEQEDHTDDPNSTEGSESGANTGGPIAPPGPPPLPPSTESGSEGNESEHHANNGNHGNNEGTETHTGENSGSGPESGGNHGGQSGGSSNPPSTPPGSSDNPNGEGGPDTDQYLACILNGPGKSLKLGMVESSLDGVNAVARAVCVSEQACLGPIAEVFPVKGAYKRGYCNHNRNVQRLTDAQVDALLASLVSAR